MKKQLISSLLAAALAVALPVTALAGEWDGLTISPNPENVTVATAPTMTRGGAVTALWELSGKPVVNSLLTFRDVEEGTEAAEAIRWAAAEGITSGYTETFFGGGDAVTRQQLAAMVYRFVQRYGLGFRGAWMFHLSCPDLDQVQEWAWEPMFWMVASRFYDGSADALLRPQKAATESEVTAVLQGLKTMAEEKQVDFTAVPPEKTEDAEQ